MNNEPIVIVGPTASGKTTVAIELAKIINGEIISADSRQIYKYLNIITSQPIFDNDNNNEPSKTNPRVADKIAHYLVGFLELNKNYSVGEFYRDAQILIKRILSNGKVPIIVGGTGLYIDILINGIAEIPSDQELREKLYEEAEKFGELQLYNKLQEVDPESARKIIPQNLRRTVRALEVYLLTGIPFSQWHKQTTSNIKNPKIFGLLWDRDKLYYRINQRVEIMWENGALEEIKTVLDKGYSVTVPGLESIGCQHLIKYLEGKYNQKQILELWKQDTRRYAKRQITWFKRNKSIIWLKVDEPLNPKELAIKIFQQLSDTKSFFTLVKK